MIYIRLFLAFLEIGAVSFGGGYGMISLVREVVLENGWLTESEFISFIAVSESTPGPLAVNMATFVGSSQGGILGGCGSYCRRGSAILCNHFADRSSNPKSSEICRCAGFFIRCETLRGGTYPGDRFNHVSQHLAGYYKSRRCHFSKQKWNFGSSFFCAS